MGFLRFKPCFIQTIFNDLQRSLRMPFRTDYLTLKLKFAGYALIHPFYGRGSGNIESYREDFDHCCGENISVQKKMKKEAFLSEERSIALTTHPSLFDYDPRQYSNRFIEGNILLGLPRNMDMYLNRF